MTILIAPNAFKGSLTANEAAEAIAKGIARALPEVLTRQFPVADGGDGLLDVLAGRLGCEILTARVSDPLGRPVQARFGLNSATGLGLIEMAEASGLVRLQPNERNPLVASSFGTGELMLAAVEAGARSLMMGIGGSATNDGGMGMAAALGVRFLDEAGVDLPPSGSSLRLVASVDSSGLVSAVRGLSVDVICDVDNPLLGPQGATRVFGPQKGAGADAMEELERGLERFAAHLDRASMAWETRSVDWVPVSLRPGAGAAGGLGAALVAFLGARLRSGAGAVLDALGFDEALRDVDVVITGEGFFDRQSLLGKAPGVVGRRAQSKGIPCWVLAGQVEPGQWWRGAFDGSEVATPAGLRALPDPAVAFRHLEEAAFRLAPRLVQRGR